MTFARTLLGGVFVASAMVVGLMGMGLTAAVAGDATAGAKVFKKCAACHSLKAGKKKVGPSLHGLYGRTAGTFVDAKGKKFKHSKDLVAAGVAGLVWDAENFASYIAKPKPYIAAMIGKKKAKTKMAFKGLKKAKNVENLVAYLEPYAKGEKEGKK
jgi:cytochrome c2